MEIGETVAVANDRQEQGKCAFCGNSHAAPKRETIEAVAEVHWRREPMVDVRRPGLATAGLYPSGDEIGYQHEGHHCIALSAWCVGLGGKKPRDFIVTLNHYLHRWGYSPNRPENCVQLPGRGAGQSGGASDEAATYVAFWQSIASGKPLQMHVTYHERSQLLASKRLLRDIAMFFVAQPEICRDSSDADLREKVLKLTAQAENHALLACVRYQAPFRLHHSRMRFACEMFLRTADTRCADPRPVARARPWVRGFGGGASAGSDSLAAGLGPDDAARLEDRVVEAMGSIKLELDVGSFGKSRARRR